MEKPDDSKAGTVILPPENALECATVHSVRFDRRRVDELSLPDPFVHVEAPKDLLEVTSPFQMKGDQPEPMTRQGTASEKTSPVQVPPEHHNIPKVEVDKILHEWAS